MPVPPFVPLLGATAIGLTWLPPVEIRLKGKTNGIPRDRHVPRNYFGGNCRRAPGAAQQAAWLDVLLDAALLPSPLVGEGSPHEVRRRVRHSIRLSTPHRIECTADASDALSHKGRGRSNERRSPVNRGPWTLLVTGRRLSESALPFSLASSKRAA